MPARDIHRVCKNLRNNENFRFERQPSLQVRHNTYFKKLGVANNPEQVPYMESGKAYEVLRR